MNNKKLLYLLSLAYGIAGPYIPDLSSEDLKYINNKLVQDAIWDFEIGILKYIQDESEESLNECHQKFLDNLNKMNDDEKEYFIKYCGNLVSSIHTEKNEPNNNLKKERKL